MDSNAYIVGSNICREYRDAKANALRMLVDLIKSGEHDKIDEILDNYYKSVIYPAKIANNIDVRKLQGSHEN